MEEMEEEDPQAEQEQALALPREQDQAAALAPLAELRLWRPDEGRGPTVRLLLSRLSQGRARPVDQGQPDMTRHLRFRSRSIRPRQIIFQFDKGLLLMSVSDPEVGEVLPHVLHELVVK